MNKVDLTRVLNITPKMEEAAAPVVKEIQSAPPQDPVPTPLRFEPTALGGFPGFRVYDLKAKPEIIEP